jgi:surfactin synthase thioesterase subunit/glycosyltransferase involved in cell wall biosynthesis
MRILLAHNSQYYPAYGGGDKSNRLLVEALQARGHACRVVARTAAFGAREHEQYLVELAARGVTPLVGSGGVMTFLLRGVEVHVATHNPHLRAYLAEQIAAFDPHVILASTDDPAQLLLEAALRAGRARVVYLVRTTLAVPFGPDCAFPSAAKTDVLRRAGAVVGVSQYVADYIRRWSGIEAVHVPIALLEPGPYAELGRFDNQFVTLVNPCAVKGIAILLGLAEAMPETHFAAVPTWGTNARDRAALAAHPNITVLHPVDDIDELLARTRVLLAPSLWAEARSRIVTEAMLRGVPVLAANVGGLPEAMRGVDYLLPVRPIVRYQARLDEQMVPEAEIPEQDIGPWRDALTRLVTDRARYQELSRASRAAALDYAAHLGVEPFEELLARVVAAPRREREAPAGAARAERSLPEDLSAEKRRLLALRLRRRAWFPRVDEPSGARLRLLVFPHAGGGASAFRRWAGRLGPEVALCPARLPGRENRAGEAAFTRMKPLVEALADALLPHLHQPFAFFGHSMGAAVAFELVRHLRRHRQVLPRGLFVSGARAPQFRLGHVPPPEPSEAEFLAELRRLEGVAPEALDDPELMRRLMPALQADTALYRHYAYAEEAPLACPIYAYGGKADLDVTPAHLEAWARQTTAAFAVHYFEGGHFFLQTAEEEFLRQLRNDLRQ